jgi:hypothetical protein
MYVINIYRRGRGPYTYIKGIKDIKSNRVASPKGLG